MQLALRAPSFALATVALVASPASAQEAVWTVDDDGPANFTDIQAAVDAAASGDLILLRPGNYTWFEIDGKALTLQVDGPLGSATSDLLLPFGPATSTITVKNLAADQSVIVRGLLATNLGLLDGQTVLDVSNCAGPLIFEDCELSNREGDCALASNADSLTFVRTLLDPGLSFYDEFENVFLQRTGLRVTSSDVYLYDSTVLGSLGPDAALVFTSYPTGNGGAACRLTDSTLLASGSSFAGGQGGDAMQSVCEDGGNGGDGIVYDATSVVRLLDSSVTAGLGGTASCGLADGLDGTPLVGAPAGVVQLPGAARSLIASSPVAGGTQIDLTLTGEPGDAVLLVIGLEPTTAIYYDALFVAQHVAAPFALLALGAVPPGGALALSLPIPPLAVGNEFERYPAQALFLTPAGVFHAGPSTVTLKGAGF